MGRKVKPKPLFSIAKQRGDGDCAVVSLSMALDIPYEEVLVVAARIAPRVLKKGLYSVEIVLIANDFGRQLIKKEPKKIDLETDSGVLIVQFTDKQEHAVYLTNELIFDTNGEVWEPEPYLKANKVKILHLLKED